MGGLFQSGKLHLHDVVIDRDIVSEGVPGIIDNPERDLKDQKFKIGTKLPQSKGSVSNVPAFFSEYLRR